MKNNNLFTETSLTRSGLVDMWNAFMVKNAIFEGDYDMPLCPCTAKSPPKELISYEDAKSLYKKEIKNGNTNFFVDAFIHFYIDDQKFDGKQSSVWLYPEKALEVIKHFAGIITVDFSTYSDFPDAIKRYNTYRMRAFGCWIASLGIQVINNVRWGTVETWEYCFDGIPKNSMVCIGSVASGIRKLENRPLFEFGLNKMVEVLCPHTIIIYGSANYPFIQNLKAKGITIIVFPSKTSLVFERRQSNE